MGEEADLSGGQIDIDVSMGAQWGLHREIRAEFLHALCTGYIHEPLASLHVRTEERSSKRSWPVHTRGVRVRGAKVVGRLDLSFAELAAPLALHWCFLDCEEPPNFEQTCLPALSLSGSDVPGLYADGLRTRGNVQLNAGFTAGGEVWLANAEIGGNLDCSGGTFNNADGDALTANWATVTGSMFLRNGFKAEGVVRLQVAVLGGLDCSGSTFSNAGRVALLANRMTVTGAVFLSRGFKAEGEVKLVDATLGGLECSGGTFSNVGERALFAERATVTGNVFLKDGFKAEGEVCLQAATLGGLDCSDGTFSNAGGDALNVDGATVTGGVFLTERFKAEGAVRLLNTTISGWLDCSAASFLGDTSAIDGERMSVSGAFVWKPAARPTGVIDLADAHVGELRDTETAWPSPPHAVNLDGFTYDSFETVGTAKQRLSWVSRYHSDSRYAPQPYEQLAAYFRRIGREPDARTVAIGKEQTRRSTLGRWRRPWHWLFGLTVGYGYRLWRALVPLVLLVAVGAILFGQAHAGCQGQDAYHAKGCAMTATAESDQLPVFQPIVYALDTVLPIIDLRQQDFWTPKDTYRWWFWTSIAGGWMLTTAVVAGLTKAISKN